MRGGCRSAASRNSRAEQGSGRVAEGDGTAGVGEQTLEVGGLVDVVAGRRERDGEAELARSGHCSRGDRGRGPGDIAKQSWAGSIDGEHPVAAVVGGAEHHGRRIVDRSPQPGRLEQRAVGAQDQPTPRADQRGGQPGTEVTAGLRKNRCAGGAESSGERAVRVTGEADVDGQTGGQRAREGLVDQRLVLAQAILQLLVVGDGLELVLRAFRRQLPLQLGDRLVRLLLRLYT